MEFEQKLKVENIIAEDLLVLVYAHYVLSKIQVRTLNRRDFVKSCGSRFTICVVTAITFLWLAFVKFCGNCFTNLWFRGENRVMPIFSSFATA